MGKLFRIWRNRKTGELLRDRRDENSESLPLVFDNETKIVYYKFSEFMSVTCNYCNMEADSKAGFMSPYISKNGKLCRFIDNKIVEIG